MKIPHVGFPSPVEKGKLEIGQSVFENVFNGYIEEVLAKNPKRLASLPAICDVEALMVDHRKWGSGKGSSAAVGR